MRPSVPKDVLVPQTSHAHNQYVLIGMAGRIEYAPKSEYKTLLY